jgi:colicin import membrane protein
MYVARHIEDPSSLFRRALTRSFVGHVIFLVLFLALPLAANLFKPELPAGSFFVELAPDLPPGPPPAPAAEEQAEAEEPEQKEEEIPQPPKPEVKKTEVPVVKKEEKKEEKKPEKPKIKVSTNLVKRTDVKTEKKPAPTGKKMSESEIKRLLASGITGTGGGGGSFGLGGTGTGPATDMDLYYGYVFKILYEAWIQPSDLAGSQISSSVRIRVKKDGTILARDMIRPSGNAVMDQSVMKAVNKFNRLKPLPASFNGSSKDITIDFQLEAML